MMPLQMLREINVLHRKHDRPLPLKIVLSYEDFYELVSEMTTMYRATGKPLGIHEAYVYGMRITDPDGEFNDKI